MNRNYDPTQPHHRPNGFRNRSGDAAPRSLAEVLRWKREAARNGLPPPAQAPTPQVMPELGFLRANALAGTTMAPTVTWIGHATAMAQLGGTTLLTDPIFSERASPVSFAGPRRHVPPGINTPDLPRIDLVLVSHNHYDHLDDASVRALNAQPGEPPLFIVPLGLRCWLAQRGIHHAVELDWWQVHHIKGPRGGIDVMLSPAQHWSGRGLRDRMATLWGGVCRVRARLPSVLRRRHRLFA